MTMHPKKSLGQHFLSDPKILQKIADFAQVEKGDTVVEVGPGQGSLTKYLLGRAERVVAVEKDHRMVELLREKYKEEVMSGRLEIVEGDILDFDTKKGYKLVGNIPYNITGAIFHKFLESENRPSSITFVIQKEVAQRIMARDKKESILSISVKVFGKPEYGGVIKAGSFSPPPAVDSGLLAVRKIEGRKDLNIEEFFRILRSGFAHKRKLLRNNLELETGVLRAIGIEEKARAEELEVEDWLRLTEKLI